MNLSRQIKKDRKVTREPRKPRKYRVSRDPKERKRKIPQPQQDTPTASAPPPLDEDEDTEVVFGDDEIFSQWEDSKNDASEDEDEDEDTNELWDHVLFISDSGINPNIQEQLKDFSTVKEYSEAFINRSCADMLEMGVKNIWINLSNKDARKWLGTNLKKNKKSNCYTVVCTYRGSKYQKWIDDAKDFARVVCKDSDLQQLRSLNEMELLSCLQNNLYLHGTPNILARLLGCSKMINHSKKKSSKK